MRPGGEHLVQDRRDSLGLRVDLLFAQPDRLEAAGPQLEVAGTIFPETLLADA
jgi:hypothetical protein